MKQFAVELLKSSTKAFVITTVVFGTAVFAVSFPTSTPAGQTAGGNFMTYFTKMLVSTNLATTDGTVKNADKVDGLHASEIGGGLSAAGESSKNPIVSYVVLSDGKTCPSGYAQFNMTDAVCSLDLWQKSSYNDYISVRCWDGVLSAFYGSNTLTVKSGGLGNYWSLNNKMYGDGNGGSFNDTYYREGHPGNKVICIKN